MIIFIMPLFMACNTTKETVPEDVIVVDTGTDTAEASPSEPTTEPESPPELGTDSVGEGEILPEEEDPYRNKKRMSVSQIRTTMLQVSGGISWIEQNKERWEHYSATLGVPDYQQRIREERTPSVMFQKFLNDAALHTCAEWIRLEIESDQRLFFAEIEPDEYDPVKIRENLVYLRHRIQGRKLDPNHPMVDDLVELHQLVMLRSEELENAWNTVCVGLFTHPDFFMY